MEKLQLSYPSAEQLPKEVQIQVGVVSSGDLEVLFESNHTADQLVVEIVSSTDNSSGRWKALWDRLSNLDSLPAGFMQIHDFGATPGVARLRIEQVLEKARHE